MIDTPAKRTLRTACLVIAGCLLSIVDAAAMQLLYSSQSDGQSLTRDAIKAGGALPVDREISDDFTATGELQRIVMHGYDCFNCAPALSSGVFVRIYARAMDGAPAALLHEIHYDAEDPRFIHDPNRSGHEATLDITLPQPIEIDGGYFLSVQLEYPGAAVWPLWSAHSGAPVGSAFYERDRLLGGAWVHGQSPFGAFANHDLAFELYGRLPGPAPSQVVAECGEWRVAAAPLPEGAVNAQLRAVKAFGPNDVWAVGDYERIVQGTRLSYSLAMHHAGGGWSIVPTPSPGACPICTEVFVSAIDGVAANDIWASGWKTAQSADGYLGGQLFTMHYDGDSWSEVPAPQTSGATGAYARGIKALASDDVWFVGDWIGVTPWNTQSSTPALAMHWNGSTFALHRTPYPAGGTPGWSYEAVAGSSDDLWAVGGGSDGDPAGASYFGHWNGSDWTLSQPAVPGIWKRFSHLLAMSPDQVIASGESFDLVSGYFGVIARFDGTQWNVETPRGGGGPIASFGPDRVFVFGAPSLYWNGSHWAEQPDLPDIFGTLDDIEVTGPCNAWGVGMQWLADAKRPLLVQLQPIIFASGFE